MATDCSKIGPWFMKDIHVVIIVEHKIANADQMNEYCHGNV